MSRYEEDYDYEQKDEELQQEMENVYNLHRNHSLTRSVYVPPDGGDGDEDDHRYEDSDFGVPLPVTDLTASTGARLEHGLHPENPELIEPPQIEEQTYEADKKPKPFIQPWDEKYLRKVKTSVIPANGFSPDEMPKKDDERQTIFALQKSKELSAEVLELCASENSFHKLVQLLLIRDTFEPFAVDINYSDPSNGQTPLMHASAAGLLDIVRLLYSSSFNWVIGYPLEVNKTDFTGTTALMKAAQHGHLVIVKYLAEVLNAQIDLVDYDGWSALMFASSKGHWHIVEYLVQAHDADVLATTYEGDTPLMLAANNGYLNVVRYLVEHTDAGDKFDEESMRLKEQHRREEAEANGEEYEEEQKEEATDDDGEDDESEDDDEVDGDDDGDNDRNNLTDDDAVDDDGNPLKRIRKKGKIFAPDPWDEMTPEERLEQKKKLQASLNQSRGLEQANIKGWTALHGAAHYGQLYVVHYLVSKGSNPELLDKSNQTARTISLSLLAHNRHGVPVTQPQVLAAIDAGMLDKGREKKNVKRNAVERSLIRFKRAERLLIDGDYARSYGEYFVSRLLYTWALCETRRSTLVLEEMKLREKAEEGAKAMEIEEARLEKLRDGLIRDTLQAEGKRNFFLSERYKVDKAYEVALQCLNVSLQYEPGNEDYRKKVEEIKDLQSKKAKSNSDDLLPIASTSSTKVETDSPDSESQSQSGSNSANSKSPTNEGNEGQPFDQAKEPKPPRSCSLFGFSFF